MKKSPLKNLVNVATNRSAQLYDTASMAARQGATLSGVVISRAKKVASSGSGTTPPTRGGRNGGCKTASSHSSPTTTGSVMGVRERIHMFDSAMKGGRGGHVDDVRDGNGNGGGCGGNDRGNTNGTPSRDAHASYSSSYRQSPYRKHGTTRSRNAGGEEVMYRHRHEKENDVVVANIGASRDGDGRGRNDIVSTAKQSPCCSPIPTFECNMKDAKGRRGVNSNPNDRQRMRGVEDVEVGGVMAEEGGLATIRDDRPYVKSDECDGRSRDDDDDDDDDDGDVGDRCRRIRSSKTRDGEKSSSAAAAVEGGMTPSRDVEDERVGYMTRMMMTTTTATNDSPDDDVVVINERTTATLDIETSTSKNVRKRDANAATTTPARKSNKNSMGYDHVLIQSPLRKHIKAVHDSACSNATCTATKDPFPLRLPHSSTSTGKPHGGVCPIGGGNHLAFLGAASGISGAGTALSTSLRDGGGSGGDGKEPRRDDDDDDETTDLLSSAAFLFKHSRRNLF